MNRRLMLIAAAATAATPALAQTNPPMNQQLAPANQSSGASANAQLSGADKDHVEKTAQIGHASLQMSDIAMQKARGAKVKEFAKFEHDEQTTVSEVLKSMDPNLTPPAPPDDVAQALDRLKQLKPGEAFDREFVRAQIKGHEMLRSIQQDYLKAGRNPDAVNVTKVVLGMINEHLTLLSDLQNTHLARL